VDEPYRIPAQEIIDFYKTDEKSGLTEDQVSDSITKYGKNVLPQEQYQSPLVLYIKQFANPLIPILLIAFVITVLLKEYTDAAVLFVTVVISVTLGFVQEYKAQQAVAALKKLTVPRAIVIRDGVSKEIDSSDIVPGDILVLREGMAVSCDARLIEANDLRTNESVITGEAMPVNKGVEVIDNDVITNDQVNMVFAGSTVVGGNGKAVVVGTGGLTQLGQIADSLNTVEKTKTPLQESLLKLSKLLVLLVLAVTIVLFVIGILRDHELYEMFLFAVALAVSVLPEGLVIAVTIALAYGMTVMAKRKAIVRNMMAVETLGSVTVVAVDKTGTITENKLSVSNYYVPGGGIDTTDEEAKDRINRLLTAVVLANNADLTEEGSVGDPLDIALLAWAEKFEFDPSVIRQSYKKLAELPFSSESRLMAVLAAHKTESGSSKPAIYIKGSPNEVIDRCSKEYLVDREVMLSASVKADIQGEVEKMANNGLKPLAIAYATPEAGQENLEMDDISSGLVFLGLIGFSDPLRAEAKESVEAIQRAGIRVMMLTGDHAVTASQIALQVGLNDPETVLVGQEIDAMSDEELKERLKKTNIYARVTPKHKLRLIGLLQELHEVVAMTGDGVNDAPALVKADIGVSMGVGGTDVARSASDMIILDNNIATIQAAVEEGRGIFDNVKKEVLFLLSTNVGEIFIMFIALVAGLPLPLYPTQILWLNLITDGVPATALIFEPKEEGIMQRKPRDKNHFILDRFGAVKVIVLGLGMAGISLFVYVFYSSKEGLEYARSVTLVVMAFAQLFNAYNIAAGGRSVFTKGIFSNRFLNYAIIVSAIMQLAVVQVPFMQNIFRTVPISITDWAVAIIASSGILIINEAIRLFSAYVSFSLKRSEKQDAVVS
jgi:Ca2+-transporting ATPase